MAWKVLAVRVEECVALVWTREHKDERKLYFSRTFTVTLGKFGFGSSIEARREQECRWMFLEGRCLTELWVQLCFLETADTRRKGRSAITRSTARRAATIFPPPEPAQYTATEHDEIADAVTGTLQVTVKHLGLSHVHSQVCMVARSNRYTKELATRLGGVDFASFVRGRAMAEEDETTGESTEKVETYDDGAAC